MKVFKEEQLRQLVGSQIFTVTFIKKDGTERVMNCRLGVKKYLKGGTGSIRQYPAALNHLIVFDMQKKEYRTINVDTLQSLKFQGKELTFSEQV